MRFGWKPWPGTLITRITLPCISCLVPHMLLHLLFLRLVSFLFLLVLVLIIIIIININTCFPSFLVQIFVGSLSTMLFSMFALFPLTFFSSFFDCSTVLFLSTDHSGNSFRLRRSSFTLAIQRHNVVQTWDVSRESPERIASRWILSRISRLLCISITMSVTKVGTRGARVVEPIMCLSFAMIIVPSFTVMSSELNILSKSAVNLETEVWS
jgi:hypothetical protein